MISNNNKCCMTFIIQAKMCSVGFFFFKTDSGIGTTYFTTSSTSSSNNTSPESDKDLLLLQNEKTPKHLPKSKIDATSTPATQIKRHRLESEKRQKYSKKSRGIDDTLCYGTSMNTTEDMGTVNMSSSLVVYCENEERKQYPLKNIQLESQDNVTPISDGQRRWSTKVKSAQQTSVSLKLNLRIADLIDISETDEMTSEPKITKSTLASVGGRRRQRRMHACEHCDKQFDRPSLLKRHTLTHTGERPFECKYCSKGFSTRSGVNTHERTHTGQRPYVCRICGRRFAAGSNLIFHKYTHTNTRRHMCSQCPKAFVTPGDLRKHEYTHTGEWPFRCELCDRGFATERNLKSHEVTHTGRKPYTCNICGKGYAQESSMKTHIRTHQRENQVTTKTKKLSNNVPNASKDPLSNSPKKADTHLQNKSSRTLKAKFSNGEYVSNGSFVENPDASNKIFSSDSSASINPVYHNQHSSAFSVPKHRLNQAQELSNPMSLSVNESTYLNYASSCPATFPLSLSSTSMCSMANPPPHQLSELYERYQILYNCYLKAISNQNIPQTLVPYDTLNNINLQGVPIFPPAFTYSSNTNIPITPGKQQLIAEYNFVGLPEQSCQYLLQNQPEPVHSSGHYPLWIPQSSNNSQRYGANICSAFLNHNAHNNLLTYVTSNSTTNNQSNISVTSNINSHNNMNVSTFTTNECDNLEIQALDYSTKTLSKMDKIFH
ncbi:unnamed protein product [Heterobilharzia americana]|nr:unnamed protein product [Heterobilharzia americana]